MAEKRKDSKGRVLKTGESERADGRYQYRFTQNGKRHTLYANTLKELREKEDEAQKSKEQKIDYMKGRITLIEMCEVFMETKQNIRPSTRVSYESAIKNFEKYNIGRLAIADITPSDVKKMCIEQAKEFKYNTIKGYLGVLNQIFKMACEDDIIQRNPCSFKLSNVISNDKTARYAITDEEADAFINALTMFDSSQKYVRLAVFLLHTGLRIGECQALTISDIDFKKRTVFVNKQVSESGDKRHIATTKTMAGVRIVPLNDAAYSALKEEIELNPPGGFVLDGYTGFIFHHNNTTIWSPSIRYNFNMAVDRYNEKKTPDMIPLPHITPHILRHTFCSRLVQKNFPPKALQYIMGHSDVRVSLDIYTHTSTEWILNEFAQIMTPSLTPNLTPKNQTVV